MYCRNCGKEVLNEAVVCIHCGCSLREAPTQNTKNNLDIMAVLGLVFSFIMPVVGLILSIIARNRLKLTDNNTYKNLALAGLIISIVNMVLTALIIIFYVFIMVIALSMGEALLAVNFII